MIEPMKNFSCDNVRDGCRFLTLAVFLTKGVIHEADFCAPIIRILVLQKSHFGSSSAILSQSSFFGNFITKAVSSISVPFERARKSSMNTRSLGIA